MITELPALQETLCEFSLIVWGFDTEEWRGLLVNYLLSLVHRKQSAKSS